MNYGANGPANAAAQYYDFSRSGQSPYDIEQQGGQQSSSMAYSQGEGGNYGGQGMAGNQMPVSYMGGYNAGAGYTGRPGEGYSAVTTM